MDVLLNENLKKCRTNKGNTQEELAAFLGITVQAVSKWERGEGYPDITLLPGIAMFYGISIDDLLGIGQKRIDEKLAELWRESDVLQRKADFDANLTLWSEVAREIPNDARVQHGYMVALHLKNQTCADPNEYADEIIKAAEYVYANSKESQHRYHVIWNLVRLYNRLGDEAKAAEYAKRAPYMDITQDNLFSIIYKGEKAVDFIQHNLCCFLDIIDGQVKRMVKQGNFDTAGKRKARTFCLNLFTSLFEDGDYGYYATRVAWIYMELAICDAEDGNIDGVVTNLESAAEYGIKFMTQGGFKRTSFLVNRTAHEAGHQGYPNTADSEGTRLLKITNRPIFDICRDDARFKKIIAKLEAFV
jgi:transcriptional regulator with XRE-family HTH domain